MAFTLKQQMAADLDRVFLNPAEFADVVTHQPRVGASFQVNAIWTPLLQGGIVDDQESRRTVISGDLVVSSVQVDGTTATVIDDQGHFVIDGISYQVENCVPTSGGFAVTVRRTGVKLSRTLNSRRR